jgi:RNA polymerase sigma-70 factor (ECF subfamily)
MEPNRDTQVGGPRDLGPRPCETDLQCVFRVMRVVPIVAESADLLYERAFAAHWDDVFRFSLAWTNDWAAAEDMAQDAYLRLWGTRDRIDWEQPVLPWLLVTARHLATDRFRSLRRRLLPSDSATIGLNESVRARWLDVQAAMGLLSPLERTALVMTAIEGITYDEAAQTLGTSAGALRAAVSRARQKLEAA